MERLLQRIRSHSHVWFSRTLAPIRLQAEASAAGVAFDSLLNGEGERLVLIACVFPGGGVASLQQFRVNNEPLPFYNWFDETMGSVIDRCGPAGGIFCCGDVASSAVLVCSIRPELFPSMEECFGIPPVCFA